MSDVMKTTNNRTVTENTGARRMTPEEVLQYVMKLGEDIRKNASTALAMITFAKENNIPVDLTENVTLGSFEARGEREIDLLSIREELADIKVALRDQGVRVTYKDIARPLPPK